MSLGDLTDSNAVIRAVEAFDELGRDTFLARHGFGPARKNFLLYRGLRCDATAIAGVAYGYQYPDREPLDIGDLNGQKVAERLRALGFEVTKTGFAPRGPAYWALSANPKRNRIAEAVKALKYAYWAIDRSDVRAGDWVIIWQTKDGVRQRGIVGLGYVLENPRVRTDEDNPYWTNPDDGKEPYARVLVRYFSAPGLPLWVDDSPAGQFLADLKPARTHGGTVSTVSEAEWQQILDLAGVSELPSFDAIEATQVLKQEMARADGQGFGLNTRERAAVEQHAMRLARQYLAELWEDVIDVSADASFDLLCRRGTDELCVEVKGTTSRGEKVILTKNAVAMAADAAYALFLVSEIELVRNGATPEAKGGICRFFSPWNQEAHQLEPIAYSCRLDLAAGTVVNDVQLTGG